MNTTTTPTERELDEATRQGYASGRDAGNWVIDGNTSAARAAEILVGYDDGDPEVMDLEPSPLSGEWAIPELSAEFDIDLEDDDIATNFETGFSQGFWDEVCRSARYAIGEVA